MSRVLRNWLLLAAFLAVLALAERQVQGTFMNLAQAGVLAGGWLAVALLAVGDGLRRAMGQRSFLGNGRGFGRFLAVIQVGLGLMLLVSLATALQ